jgi:hypothetical protein
VTNAYHALHVSGNTPSRYPASPGAGNAPILKGDARCSILWDRWRLLFSAAQTSEDPGDIAKAGDAWDDWLESYLPNPADRVPIPRPVIAVRAH